ncbi:unnamed protein product [Rotaria sp. Silwood2]|nr:unnamed protein product [Rotaria sp. Silwood2]CAF4539302.1 unnamed protein product [Rotaria sp. Silwood2]
MSQNNTQGSPSTFKRHLASHSTLGDDVRYVNNKRQRKNSQGNAEEIHDHDERIVEWTESNKHHVNEFLEAPKLLICSKCNSPGHMKKQCQLNYDRCLRCGCDWKTGDHSECSIKCHHCSGEHLSTDYKCPALADYRCELVKELKRHPERLPEHVQLFIPAQCGDRNDHSPVITNYQKNEQKIRSTVNATFGINAHS